MQPEGDGGLDAMGKPSRAPSGSEPTARWKRTAQAPGRPFVLRVARGTGVGHRPGTTGAAADGREGVGGLHTSEDVGERVGPRTRPSKGGPCWCELSKGPMTGALTSGTHVTRNSKGSGPPCLGFACESGAHRHEPHQRKSRMVETS